MIREKVKNLWKLCFDDSDEFVDLYFRMRYNNHVNVAIQSGEEVIAALQMLPYPMTYGGEEIQTAYISGACTHPDFRNRGVMRELLSQAFAKMAGNNVVLSTLIPAEPWLFDYYARSGYSSVFRYNVEQFVYAADKVPLQDGFVLADITGNMSKAYEYLNRKLRERSCCVQHTETDFQVILADLKLYGGNIFTLNTEKRIAALAIAYPLGNGWQIGEIVADTPELRTDLLQGICRTLRLSSLEVITLPTGEGSKTLGMARIINVKMMLQMYAAAHPELEMNLQITDEQIDTNNGFYYLNNGKCMGSTSKLPGKHLVCSIGELTQQVFSSINPYMSLMLN